MVIKTMSVSKTRDPRSPPGVAAQARRAAPAPPPRAARSPPAPQSPREAARRRRHSAAPQQRAAPEAASVRTRLLLPSKREVESEAGDVIDLGAPRLLRQTPPVPLSAGRQLRTRSQYKPNPRLYPGPQPKSKSRPKRAEPRGGDGRGRRRKRVFRRPVPNARLYRPAPARPPPPPAWPRATWPPPAPSARLDTASRAALRLSEQRRAPRAPPRSPRPAAPAPPIPAAPPVPAAPAPPAPAPSPPTEPPSRRLVVTVPAPGTDPGRQYRPVSEHFRLRSLDTDSGESTPAAGRPGWRAPLPAAQPAPPLAMDAGNRHSTSPEDCSDGNETLSAPSEFLAEFLSAIMRRQYAEALKYCRLILQYEPHNATARGFYPLLQHKVQAHKRAERAGEWPRGSSSEEASAHSDKPPHAPHAHEMMQQGADESEGSARAGSRSSSRSAGSCASQSSLELDSSDALVHSSPSLSLSRRTDHTDSASGGCWESSGSASRSEPDDNGNACAGPVTGPAAVRADLENDNAAAAAGDTLRGAQHKSDSASSLRRLRAQFTCSIK